MIVDIRAMSGIAGLRLGAGGLRAIRVCLIEGIGGAGVPHLGGADIPAHPSFGAGDPSLSSGAAKGRGGLRYRPLRIPDWLPRRWVAEAGFCDSAGFMPNVIVSGA